MPRVANPKVHRRSNGASTPHKNSPIKIPLNDDMGEKAARMEARQALHDRQMNQIKAAVKTPMPPRKYGSYDRGSSTSPVTPRGSGPRGRDSDDRRRAVTPMKRVPILANFEEWMKMATDNKINANNSWNFALIDYFHDMSLLKEGDSVNFQKASCTLDGCVKIYTSRVDSVATETGKLLSGLADSRDKKAREAEAEAEGDDAEDEDGEDGAARKPKKRTRTHEATLAPSFASLQLKKFELEFAVDPLFKKASADFDEGGAKGLLLNHLAIDGQGRIVFDSSDDANEGNTEEAEDAREGSADTEQPNGPSPAPQKQSEEVFEDNTEIDIGPLATQFFPDLDRLADQDICPSLKNLDLGDPTGSLDIPLLKAPEDWRHERSNDERPDFDGASGIMLDDDNAVGFDDDDATLADFDFRGDTGFGDGGEAWARDAALEPMLRVRVDRDGEDHDGEADLDNEDAYAISLSHQPENRDHENILSYFDNALQKNWAGPEHWKIRRIKENAASSTTNAAPKQRKEKEPFEIDFAAPLDPAVAESIYTPAASNSTISLPKTQWKTKGRNLLPDDKHFNSRQLLRLFLKPKARMGSKKLVGARLNHRRQDQTSGNGEMDEAFWANHKPEDNGQSDEMGAPGSYDANFFADDDGLAFPNGLGMGDDDDENLPFADAREMLSPPTDGRPVTAAGENGGVTGLSSLLNIVGATPGSALQTGGFGSQLVTQGGRRARPDYVAYARVAKKIDVRRLKTEMWKGMGDRLIASTEFESTPTAGAVTELPPEPAEKEAEAPPTPTPTNRAQEEPVVESEEQKDDQRLRFTHIMNSLKAVYPPEKLRDISTSFGFICLLHLANEQGLILQSDLTKSSGSLEEIFVAKDVNAVIEEGAI